MEDHEIESAGEQNMERHHQEAEAKHGHVEVITPHGKRRLAVLLDADDVVEQHVHGFAEFLREYSVIGLAVGFVAGSQVAVVVKQLVQSFIDPLFTLFFRHSLSSWTLTLHFHRRTGVISWGMFVYTLLDFLFILITIYAAIKLFKLDRFQRKGKK